MLEYIVILDVLRIQIYWELGYIWKVEYINWTKVY